jgi:hypothetical protein
MSADYSRWPLRDRDFAQVRLEQGRVLTDADWNEEILVTERRERLETIDGLGRAVVPIATTDAFRITELAGPDLSIGLGRAYLDGLLVENHGQPGPFDPIVAEMGATGQVLYSSQPWWRNPAPLPAKPYVAYLKAWQRERTAVSEPELIEPALGVDTSARFQTVWHVKAIAAPAGTTCAAADALVAAAEPSAGGRLTTGAAVVPGQPDPCRVVPGGGYTGLENQLYRVEIHQAGAVGGAAGATFKWSRDNATVTARVLSINQARDRIVVDSLGQDAVLAIHDGDWIEILDDDLELAGMPGELRRVAIGGGVDEASRTILLTQALPAPGAAFPVDAQFRTLPERNTRVRRWDQAGTILSATGAVLTDLDAAGGDGSIRIPAAAVGVLLEHGIVVHFALEPGGRFRTGDFWLFAARTADASVEHLERAAPIGIHAHYASLAVVDATAVDCRTVVPPLAEIEVLEYVGGDGQEATPSYLNMAPVALPFPPRVALERGPVPVAGRLVRFTIVDWPNAGSIAPWPTPPPAGNPTASLDVVTGADGTAAVTWALGWDGRESQKRQELTAQLLDDGGNPMGVTIDFSARLRIADEVAYDPAKCDTLAGAETVQQALDLLCGLGGGEGCCTSVRPEQRLAEAIKASAAAHGGHACLCLAPGVYQLKEQDAGEIVEVLRDLPVLSLTMSGRGAQLLLASPLVLTGLGALSISELEFANAVEGMDCLLDIADCTSVSLAGLSVMLIDGGPNSTAMRIAAAGSEEPLPAVRIRDCAIVSRTGREQPPAKFAIDDLPTTVRGMIALARSDAPAEDTAKEFGVLMDQPEELRLAEAASLQSLADANGDVLGDATTTAMGRLGSIIREGRNIPLSRLKTVLDRARVVGDRFTTELDDRTAIELKDGRCDTWIEDNAMTGKVVVYGSVSKPDVVASISGRLSELTWDEVEPGSKLPPLPAGAGQLRVSNNILARMTLGATASAQILRFLESGKLEVRLFGTIVVEGNALGSPLQAIVGDLVSFVSNTIAGGEKEDLGFIVANATTITGNIGPSRGSTLQMAALDRAEAANRRMTISPPTFP